VDVSDLSPFFRQMGNSPNPPNFAVAGHFHGLLFLLPSPSALAGTMLFIAWLAAQDVACSEIASQSISAIDQQRALG